MRKLILFIHVSLDGYAAGPNGELDWMSYDEDLQKYGADVVDITGSPLYGRITYQLMESYWPTVLTDPSSGQQDIEHAQWLDNVTKVVFSKTLQEVKWKNTILINDNVAEEITKLKQQPGQDLVIFGSPGFAQTLMKLDLIDEYWLTINPVVLGTGIPLFKNIGDRIGLRLIKTKTFNSGVVALRYETIRQ